MGSLLDLVKQHEGLRLKPYKDTAGVLTIGYGLNLEEGITEAEAEVLLESRIRRAQAELLSVLPEAFLSTENRTHALVSMIYNLGKTRFLGFEKMLGFIRKGEWESAAYAALDSRWATQVPTRALEIANMLRRG